MITPFTDFYRATKDGETRYYPGTGSSNRSAAMEFDAKGAPPRVNGYGVYDTNISTEYAVAIYASQDEAKSHKMSKPKPAPSTAIDTEGKSNDNEPDDPKQDMDDPAAQTDGKTSKAASKFAKLGKRG